MSILARLEMHRSCRKVNLLDLIGIPAAAQRKTKVNYKVLSRHLRWLVQSGRAVVQGAVPNFSGAGPPEISYGVEKIRADLLMHELIQTEVAQAWGFPPMLRGMDVPGFEVKDGDKVKFTVYPDGIWMRAENRHRIVEVDMATEGFKEIIKKVRAYCELDNAVLFLTVTETRRKKLLRWLKGLELGYVALWREVVKNPWGPVWMTTAGQQTALVP
jgi:hypothetical protein